MAAASSLRLPQPAPHRSSSPLRRPSCRPTHTAHAGPAQPAASGQRQKPSLQFGARYRHKQTASTCTASWGPHIHSLRRLACRPCTQCTQCMPGPQSLGSAPPPLEASRAGSADLRSPVPCNGFCRGGSWQPPAPLQRRPQQRGGSCPGATQQEPQERRQSSTAEPPPPKAVSRAPGAGCIAHTGITARAKRSFGPVAVAKRSFGRDGNRRSEFRPRRFGAETSRPRRKSPKIP